MRSWSAGASAANRQPRRLLRGQGRRGARCGRKSSRAAHRRAGSWRPRPRYTCSQKARAEAKMLPRQRERGRGVPHQNRAILASLLRRDCSTGSAESRTGLQNCSVARPCQAPLVPPRVIGRSGQEREDRGRGCVCVCEAVAQGAEAHPQRAVDLHLVAPRRVRFEDLISQLLRTASGQRSGPTRTGRGGWGAERQRRGRQARAGETGGAGERRTVTMRSPSSAHDW